MLFPGRRDRGNRGRDRCGAGYGTACRALAGLMGGAAKGCSRRGGDPGSGATSMFVDNLLLIAKSLLQHGDGFVVIRRGQG